MKDSRLFPVALMYVGGDGVDGATRMQKLVFLGQEEFEIPEKYDYEPGPFGPYSSELEYQLSQLANKGLVEVSPVRNEVGNEKHVYRLTDSGILLGKKMASSDELRPYLDIAEEVLSEYGDRPLGRLLGYVYSRYEELTICTELDTDRLRDPEARSQFLEPGEKYGQSKYLGGISPEESHSMRSSAKELFSVQ